MKLINKTKNSVLAEEIKRLSKLKEMVKGLAGKDIPESVYFQTRWGIHTFGMRFNLDCVIFDNDMVVRKIKERLKPGKIFFWNPKFFNVVELPEGTIKKTRTELFDKLSWPS